MTKSEALAVFETITYARPRRALYLEFFEDVGVECRLLMKTTDSITGKEDTVITHTNRMDLFMIDTKNALRHWIYNCIEKAEIHEAQEFFKVNGERHIDPHRYEVKL